MLSYVVLGYLFLKGLIPPETALEQRRNFFETYNGTSLLAPSTTLEQGIFSGNDPDAHADIQINFYHKTTASVYSFAKREDFLEFCKQPALTEFLTKFFDEEPFLYTRKIIRYNLPGEDHSTAVHIDRTFLRDATPNLVSVWIPLGPATVEMGSLMYLEESHTIGVDMEDEWTEVNRDLSPDEKINPYNVNMGEGGAIGKDAPGIAEKYNRRWLVADYEPGDVVLHTPFLIHSACQNQDPEKRIRLSTDLRFQPKRYVLTVLYICFTGSFLLLIRPLARSTFLIVKLSHNGGLTTGHQVTTCRTKCVCVLIRYTFSLDKMLDILRLIVFLRS